MFTIHPPTTMAPFTPDWYGIFVARPAPSYESTPVWSLHRLLSLLLFLALQPATSFFGLVGAWQSLLSPARDVDVGM